MQFERAIQKRERRQTWVYRHQATISFVFALAAQVQAFGSLVYFGVCHCYPLPQAAFLAPNIVYVVLFFVYLPFWLSSRYHAAFSYRDPSPQRHALCGANTPQPQQVIDGGNITGQPLHEEDGRLVARHPEPSDWERGYQAQGPRIPKTKHQ
ncbi:uncharacterized protein PG998_006008 [Apiospora kogelbergensis]|uniref:uncharacterized protein n=1 Tax=Apiospora kogelbergensis TaxID=1337665 RepID=UPI00312E721D